VSKHSVHVPVFKTEHVVRQYIDCFRTKRFWVFAFMMILAGGSEGAFTFWSASYIQVHFAALPRMGGIGTACFAGGMLIMRFASGLLVAQDKLRRAIFFSAAGGIAVSLAVPEKTTCAIVGPSGSGKTTLCNLIARFWDVREGGIAVGGVDVRDITCDSLLTNFSIVFQNVYLFNDTIENNIRIGRRDATDEGVREAARRACCHEFISALPDGYQTMVGEGGSSLSGGERQRISIARALLKDAPIVILDEATASVDPENERELQKAIAELTRGKTLLMIAHHLATVRDADQIVVLDKGRIVQRGTHAELMGQGGLYRQLVSIRQQASGWAIRREATG